MFWKHLIPDAEEKEQKGHGAPGKQDQLTGVWVACQIFSCSVEVIRLTAISPGSERLLKPGPLHLLEGRQETNSPVLWEEGQEEAESKLAGQSWRARRGRTRV